MPPPVIIFDYDPQWPVRFEAAKRTITQALGELLVSIEHDGSTAVPDLAAKPIIDIMPGIRRFEDGFDCVSPLEALGYEYNGEHGIPGRHYFDHFDKDGAQGTGIQHVHMVVAVSELWAKQILFRDYLRANSREAAIYARLKRSLAERYRNDREAYTEAKSDFVAGALRRAKAWDRRAARTVRAHSPVHDRP